MTVQIEDVTVWWTHAGISHVVLATDGHCTHTLCGSMCSGAPETEPPKKRRVCRKCRGRLADTTPVDTTFAAETQIKEPTQ